MPRFEVIPVRATVNIAETRDEMVADDGLFLRIGTYLDQWVQRNFRSSGGNVGGWAPFKYGGRLTVKAKGNAKSVDGHHWIDGSAMLELYTGALRASFAPTYGRYWPGRQSFVTIGSDLPYAAYQNSGTSVLPARRLIPVEDEVIGDLMDIVNSWVAEKTKRGGGK